jgi:hypothetical protein
MFSLKHFYYAGSTGGTKFRKVQGKEGNTYTGTIEQIKILQVNPVIPSPHREPTMKSVKSSPSSNKGKTTLGSKRPNVSPPAETSPSKSKRLRIEGRFSSVTNAACNDLLSESSSSSTIDETEPLARKDDSFAEDDEVTTIIVPTL